MKDHEAEIERLRAFVKYLREQLDGFLGDQPIVPAGLRKVMEDHGV